MAFDTRAITGDYKDLRFKMIGAAENRTLFKGRPHSWSRLRGDDGSTSGRAVIGYGYDIRARCGGDVMVFLGHLNEIGAGGQLTDDMRNVLAGYEENGVRVQFSPITH